MLAGAMKGDMSRYDMTPTNTPLKMAPREVTTKIMICTKRSLDKIEDVVLCYGMLI
jgi:hypothetical protein